jgi:hypothetical protein
MKSLFKGLTTLLLVSLVSVSLAASAFASSNQFDATPQFTAADTQLLFEQDADTMQVAALSEQEMEETEGAWVNFAVGGALGLGSYALTSWLTKKPMTWKGALTSTAIGVATSGVAAFGARAVGPASAWLRVGSSFSKTSRVSTTAIRWGSNSFYRNRIGSAGLRSLNKTLHNVRLPGNSWRVRDAGHLHLWRR